MSKLTDKIEALQDDVLVFVRNPALDIALRELLADVRELEGNYNHCMAVIEARERALPMNLHEAKRQAYEHTLTLAQASAPMTASEKQSFDAVERRIRAAIDSLDK
jgi:hypothetical protein